MLKLVFEIEKFACHCKTTASQRSAKLFSHLANRHVRAINDVFDHIATSEFTADYMQSNNIGAMLDGSILLNNQVIGVVCHEHVGGARDWTLDEEGFADSVADLVRLTV